MCEPWVILYAFLSLSLSLSWALLAASQNESIRFCQSSPLFWGCSRPVLASCLLTCSPSGFSNIATANKWLRLHFMIAPRYKRNCCGIVLLILMRDAVDSLERVTCPSRPGCARHMVRSQPRGICPIEGNERGPGHDRRINSRVVESLQAPDELVQSNLEQLVLDALTALVLDGRQGILDHCRAMSAFLNVPLFPLSPLVLALHPHPQQRTVFHPEIDIYLV